MKIADKLTKVSESVVVYKYDNGYLFELSGYNKNDEWSAVKIFSPDLEGINTLLQEFSKMPQSS